MLSGKNSLWREGYFTAGHWSWLWPQKHLCCLAPRIRTGPGMAVSPVPEARDRAPAGGHPGVFVPWFGSVHDPAAAIPVLCSLPTPPRAHQHPCWDCRGAVHDFTRDWCSWYCSWAGSMHASWKISCGESGLSEGNPPRLLLQTQPSFREARSWLLPSLASPLQQLRAGEPHVPWRGEVVPPGRRGHQCPESCSSGGTSQKQ